jgi:hypothetical protein
MKLKMKILFALLALFTINNCFSQAVAPNTSIAPQKDTSLPNLVFFEDFNDNRHNWGIDKTKNISSKIDGGFYYLTANGHAYGEANEVKIDTRKDFEIETRIKIVSGNSEHKNYYSMLFWGREAMDGYFFSFAKDGFVSVQTCQGKNQKDCIIRNGSLQKTSLNPDDFNVYMIRKTGRTYYFFVNGTQVYVMPFTPFFGNLMGVGAGRKVSLQIDYLKVIYL